MAIKTVSNTGGNYNATGTWVGGVVPATTDIIEFTATSGNLTISAVATCAGINFTNYVGTITINTSFNIKGNINFGTGGYNVAGSNTMYAAATGTITSNGTPWKGNFGFAGSSQTYTLADDLTVNNTITVSVTTLCTVNGFNMYAKNNFNNISAGSIVGTTNLFLIGTGTLNVVAGNFFIGLNTTINTLGTITFGANGFKFGNGKTFTYIAGTVVSTTGLYLLGNCSLDISNFTLANLIISVPSTYTLLSPLNISGTFNVLNNATQTGSFGFTCGTLQMGQGTLTLPPSVVNTVTTNMTNTIATLVFKGLINCSTVGGTKAILNLSQGATQDNGYLSATDVDSSGGRSIWTYKGILTRTLNWNQMSTNPKKHVLNYRNRILK